jgi:hypothetical protein
LTNNLIGHKVLNGLLNFAIGFSGNVDDVFDEVGFVALELLAANLVLLLPVDSRNIFQNQ